MPSIRFACDTFFQTTVESPLVPRIGERVVLVENELKVNYRVKDVAWDLAEGRVNIDVDRELSNPCTKCRQFKWALQPVQDDDFHLGDTFVGWECEACNYPLHHNGQPRPPTPVPDPRVKDWHY
jgi:hypothetical protein